MATLPKSVQFDTDIEYVSQPSLTWLIINNKVSGMDEGIAAMRQAVEIILNVERFRWQIYTSNFGTETEDLIGEEADYIESELTRRVTEALEADDRVTGVDNFAFSYSGDTMTMTFDVETVFGAITEAVTI